MVQGPVLAVERVPRDEISSYGVIDAEPLGKDAWAARLPGQGSRREAAREEAPSDLAIIGRYILTPDIFAALETTERDKAGEIQLTNGLRALLKRRADLRLRDRGRPPRHRQQAGLPEGDGLLRAEAAGAGRAVQGLPVEAGHARRRIARRAQSFLAGVLSRPASATSWTSRARTGARIASTTRTSASPSIPCRRRSPTSSA